MKNLMYNVTAQARFQGKVEGISPLTEFTVKDLSQIPKLQQCGNGKKVDARVTTVRL